MESSGYAASRPFSAIVKLDAFVWAIGVGEGDDEADGTREEKDACDNETVDRQVWEGGRSAAKPEEETPPYPQAQAET